MIILCLESVLKSKIGLHWL